MYYKIAHVILLDFYKYKYYNNSKVIILELSFTVQEEYNDKKTIFRRGTIHIFFI